MLNNGASLAVIQQLLGHARISTTAGHGFVSTALMHKTYNAAHPARELAGRRFSQILGHDQLGCDCLVRPGIDAVDDEGI
jgi:hypothetical protein